MAVSQRIKEVAAMVLAGVPIGALEDVAVVRRDFYHRQDLGLTGTKVTFFNVPEEEFVCNWPGNGGGLPPDHLFVAHSLRCQLAFGYDTAGNAESAAAGNQADQDPMTIAEDLRTTLEHGLVKFQVGDQLVAEFYGLYKAPSGGGVEVDFSTANTTASTIVAELASVRNGSPHDTNGYQIPPYVIGPNRRVSLTNAWRFNRDLLANSDLVLKWEIMGTLIKPANF